VIGARVRIALKRSVVDPQGAAVATALRALGHGEVRSVRVGRVVELVVDAEDETSARAAVDAMCQALLVNTVVETWEVDIVDAGQVGGLSVGEAACV